MFSGWRGVHRASSAIAGFSAVLGEDGLSVRTYTENFFFFTLRQPGSHGALPGDLRGRRYRSAYRTRRSTLRLAIKSRTRGGCCALGCCRSASSSRVSAEQQPVLSRPAAALVAL